MGNVLRAAHPVTAVTVTAIAGVLGWSVGLPIGALVLLIVAIGAGQLSVGWMNDWLDARDDITAERRDKPIAVGEVSVATVQQAAIISGLIAILTSALLGIAGGVFALLVTASGWAYDVRAKKSWASFVPSLIAFAALPGAATLSLTPAQWPAWWACAIGGLLGVGAHFATTLRRPDRDSLPGQGGLPQRLGSRWSATVATLSLVLAASLGVIGPALTRRYGEATAVLTGETYEPPLLGPAASLIGLAVTLAIAVVVLTMVRVRRRDRWPFRLLVVAALIQVVVLVTQGPLIPVPN